MKNTIFFSTCRFPNWLLKAPEQNTGLQSAKELSGQIHESCKPPASVVHLVSWWILFKFCYTFCRCYAIALIILNTCPHIFTILFFFFNNTLSYAVYGKTTDLNRNRLFSVWRHQYHNFIQLSIVTSIPTSSLVIANFDLVKMNHWKRNCHHYHMHYFAFITTEFLWSFYCPTSHFYSITP